MEAGSVNREERNSGRGSVVAFLVVLILLLPVIYVLSLGPAVYCVQAGYVAQNSALMNGLEVLYWPLEWLHEQGIASDALDAYVNWWTS